MSNSLGTVTVMGAGAWGTAIAKVAADAGNARPAAASAALPVTLVRSAAAFETSTR